MRYLLFFLFGLNIFISVGQKPAGTDYNDRKLDSLGWHSFFITPAYVPQIKLDAFCDSLQAHHDNHTIRELYGVIGEKDKSVICHILLTRIMEPDSGLLSEEYIYKKDSVVAWHFTYNHLSWVYHINEGINEIDDSQIDYAKQYWRNRLRKIARK